MIPKHKGSEGLGLNAGSERCASLTATGPLKKERLPVPRNKCQRHNPIGAGAEPLVNLDEGNSAQILTAGQDIRNLSPR